ncbi:MAG: hypothetical protein OIN66_05590 [Candidatus Methanoperedens sp.]|nr:hypothetical protein [Candidatus Methanoperedens sp.]
MDEMLKEVEEMLEEIVEKLLEHRERQEEPHVYGEQQVHKKP